MDKQFEQRFDILQKEIVDLSLKISNIEGQMTRPKIVPFINEEEPKEN